MPASSEPAIDALTKALQRQRAAADADEPARHRELLARAVPPAAFPDAFRRRDGLSDSVRACQSCAESMQVWGQVVPLSELMGIPTRRRRVPNSGWRCRGALDRSSFRAGARDRACFRQRCVRRFARCERCRWHMRCSFCEHVPRHRHVWRYAAMTPEQDRPTEEVLRRVQGEFLEMPGLRLTERAGAPAVGSRRRRRATRCSARWSMRSFCSRRATERSCKWSTRRPSRRRSVTRFRRSRLTSFPHLRLPAPAGQ